MVEETNSKILLAYPGCLDKRISSDDATVVPMGLFYIGALLKSHGYDVRVENLYTSSHDLQALKKLLKEINPDILGLSVVNANRWGAFEVARVAKELNPHVRVVFGGVGATFLWEHFLNTVTCVDYVVMGEGEYTFLNLVRALEKKDLHVTVTAALDETDLGKIPGLAFRKNGRAFSTPPAQNIQDLDELPNPARYYDFQHLSMTRGCPYNCYFCGSPKFWGEKKVRSHSPEYFVDQLEMLHGRGIEFFYISDDTFTMNKRAVIAVCLEILKRNLKISWAAISRVNCIDEEILLHMRRAGCMQISYGIESGSPRIRKALGKQIENVDVVDTFKLTQSYGMLARGYFIYGCPGEDEGSIDESIALIQQVAPLGIVFYMLTLFPGTALYDKYCKASGQTDDMWRERIEDLPYFQTDPDLSMEVVLGFGKKLREFFHGNLSDYARRVSLVDKKELYPGHADFLSRLGMTFSHGDYASLQGVKNPMDTAQYLYEKALGYYPDHRAYLGLGMIFQKKRAFARSVEILSMGIESFPKSEQLNLCKGISCMNLGKFADALTCFVKFEKSPAVIPYIEACHRSLGKPVG